MDFYKKRTTGRVKNMSANFASKQDGSHLEITSKPGKILEFCLFGKMGTLNWSVRQKRQSVSMTHEYPGCNEYYCVFQPRQLLDLSGKLMMSHLTNCTATQITEQG